MSTLGDDDDHSPDTGKNGRKATISRVNRACNNCRRMKMRCVGGDDPPCKRCQHAGLECILERPGKSHEPIGDERLSILEHQVSSISTTLSDLVKVLQTSMPGIKPQRPPPSQAYQLMDWGPLIPGQTEVSQAIDRIGTTMGPPPKRPSPSLPPSRAVSMGPDDVLGADISRPLAAMSNMAGLVEAAMEKSREEDKVRAAKRTYSPEPSGPSVVESQQLAEFRPSKRLKREPKVHVHAFPDAVAEGLVSEKEGKEMMRIFYEGCFDFLPCFDPSIDTWESLRLRSPFSITTIIMIGARVRDGGGPASDVQLACRSHAQKIASGTLFASSHRIEAVQAMALLATFTDRGWLSGGHAVRMGLDMGLDQAFGQLLRNGMGSGKSREDLAGEQALVVQTRVWFCLYLFEHQMAYGNGRPAILREDQSIKQCRRFLDHPLSIPSDARLVSMVELTALRAPLHNEIISSLESSATESILECLRQANRDFEEWEKYWLCTYMQRDNADSFLYESLAIQRQYSALFSNSQLLRDVRNPEDVFKLGPEAQTLALQSIRNAERCVDICLRNEQYRRRLRYAVHYTHVCAAFAASFLLRITSLIPDAIDFDKTINDVKELADLLSEIPAPRYGRSLKLLLRRAKRRHPEPTLVPFPTVSPTESSHLDAMFQDAMPLFLNDQSLGAPAPTDGPYAGIEDFFLPMDLDSQLQGLTETPETAASGPWW